MNICITDPVFGSRGGHAYHGPQPTIQNSGRKKRKRQDANLSGLNALPPGVNMTIFKQTEPWVNDEVEMKTCTWLAVSKGEPISTCPG